MKKLIKKLVLILLICSLIPHCAYAGSIEVSGSGSANAGSGSGYGNGGSSVTGKTVLWSIGFKVTKLSGSGGNGNTYDPNATSLYYILDYTRGSGRNAIKTRWFFESDNGLENYCGAKGVYHRAINGSGNEYLECKTLNNFTYITSDTFIGTKKVSEIWVLSGTGGNFSGSSLVESLSDDYGRNGDSSFVANLVNSVFGSNSPGVDDLLMIEPLYLFGPNDLSGAKRGIMTVKDMYLDAGDKLCYNTFNVFGDPYDQIGSVPYELGQATKSAYAYDTLYTRNSSLPSTTWLVLGVDRYTNNLVSGCSISSYHNGVGAVYVRAAGITGCAPDQCCFDKVSDNQYKYNVAHSTDESWQHYNKYKLKNPNNSTFVNDENQIKDTYTDGNPFAEPDSTFEKCGCDQEKECCYEPEGTGYKYVPEASGSEYYRYKYMLNGKQSPNTTAGGTFVSCGCDPETQCCYDSSGTLQSYYTYEYGEPGGYSLVNGKAVPCWCNGENTRDGSCSGTDQEYKQVNDNLICLANFDTKREQRSQAGQAYNGNIGCEVEYTISYPGNQGSVNNGQYLLIENNRVNSQKIMKLTVTTKCVSFKRDDLESFDIKTNIAANGWFTYDDAKNVIFGGLESDNYFKLFASNNSPTISDIKSSTANELTYFEKDRTDTYYYAIPRKDAALSGRQMIYPGEEEEDSDQLNKILVGYSTKAKSDYHFTTKIKGSIKDASGKTIVDDFDELTCKYGVTNNGKKWFYRTIDLDNMNKLSRKLGSNWSEGAGPDVQDEIETTGNYAVLNNQDKFSFTLDPATMVLIRDYNDAEAQNGGYNDSSLLVQSDDTGCSWHWYSSFLYCLSHGNNGSGCNKTMNIEYGTCDVSFKNEQLGNVFNHYTSISGTSNNTDEFSFKRNIVDLINKQKNISGD